MDYSLNGLRQAIDKVDQQIIELLNIRFYCCEEIGKIKQQNDCTIIDGVREQEIISRLSEQEKYVGMVKYIWPVIMNFSKSLQNNSKE